MEGKEPSHFSNPGYNSAPQPQPSPEYLHPSSISGSTVSIIQTTEDAKHRFTPATQRNFKILSIVQIILGLIAIICQTIVLIWATEIFSCMWHDFLFFFDLEPIPSEGAGLWCGVVFIFAGVIGLKACSNNDASSQKAWITACMLINILCVLMVFALIGLAALNVTDVNGALCNRQNNVALAFDAFMILAGCVELVVCIWALLLSCDREQSYNVMYNEDSRPSTPRAWSSEGQAPVPPTSTQAPVLVTPS